MKTEILRRWYAWRKKRARRRIAELIRLWERLRPYHVEETWDGKYYTIVHRWFECHTCSQVSKQMRLVDKLHYRIKWCETKLDKLPAKPPKAIARLRA